MSVPGAGPRLPIGVGLAAFALYTLTASPTAFWLDSSELAAGAFELGVTHPPGHPLFVLLGRLASLLPFGSVAFRVHVFCGALAGLGVGLAVVAARQVWRGSSAVPALAVAIALSVSVPFWFHGVRAEVYALQLALAAGIVLCALRAADSGSPRDVALLGWLTGLGLANHHYLTALLGPGALLVLLATRAGRSALRRAWPLATAGGVLGLLTYALVPLRAAALTTVRWGEADTPAGFWWLLTAKAFQKTAGRAAQVDVAGTAQHLGEIVGEQVGWVLPALALLGLGLLARRQLGPALGLALVVAGNIASQVLFDFDPTNPDVAGYFMISTWLLAVLAVGPLVFAVERSRVYSRPTRLLALLLAGLVPLLGAAAIVPGAVARCYLADQRDTEVFADTTYAFVPTDGLLVTAYFETIFNLWYRDVAECRRPDVAVVHRLFRTYPGYDAYLANRYPALRGMLAIDARTGQLDPDWLSEESARRAVLVEADPTLPEWMAARALPAGLVLQLAPRPLPEGELPTLLGDADRRVWNYLYERIDERQRETAGNLLWAQVNQMLILGGLGRTTAARERFERAWEIAPGDPDLVRMRGELE